MKKTDDERNSLCGQSMRKLPIVYLLQFTLAYFVALKKKKKKKKRLG